MSEQQWDETAATERIDPVQVEVSAPVPAPAPRRGARVATVVWGLVVVALALGLTAIANGVVFDVELAVIVLVAAAGLALLVGSLAGARRRSG